MSSEKPLNRRKKFDNDINTRDTMIIEKKPRSHIDYVNDQARVNGIRKKNRWKKILIFSAIPLVIIIFIALLLIVLKNNLEKQATVEEKESTNKIKATFSVNSGEKLQLINTGTIESKQYKIGFSFAALPRSLDKLGMTEMVFAQEPSVNS